MPPDFNQSQWYYNGGNAYLCGGQKRLSSSQYTVKRLIFTTVIHWLIYIGNLPGRNTAQRPSTPINRNSSQQTTFNDVQLPGNLI